MDDKYKVVYGSLHQQFQNQNPLLQPQAAKVRLAIDDAASQLQTTVREDAKYLVLINFVEMVYRPLLDTGALPTAVTRAQLDQIVKYDIKTLIQESAAT